MGIEQISRRAREAGIIEDPKIGLLIMGRKRPGFDPEWGAEIKGKIVAALNELPWEITTPSDNIADEAELRRSVESCRSAGVTTLIVVQPTISDGRLAPLLSRLWAKPLILWATPEKPTGAMISANSLVGTHAMAATLRQLDHPLEIVYGHPENEELRARLKTAIRAVHGADSAMGRLFGLVGYHAPGFVDFHADPVFISDALSSQLYHTGTVELISMVRAYADADIADEVAAFRALELPFHDGFSAGEGVSADGSAELAMQARYYRAFRDIFDRDRLDLLAFRCWPDLPSEVGHWPYLALARLVSEGFPIAMEGDIDGALGSRIAESAGVGPVYLSDWLEHDRDTITIWHTGAAPFQLAEPVGTPGGPSIGVQFNNKKPTVVESTIRAGMEATAFRLWRYDGAYYMAVLEGETLTPRRHLLATNGLFRTAEVDVTVWFEQMVQLGMPHHLCVVEGHHADTLRRIARLIGAVVV
ncbi:MAG: L-fucose/L-arabinose isomerase family protein [Spirochaetales bacterium]|nr:L-fucose/L-arabinose isomerase family protein [Spirochaetales bacterium]